MKTILLAIFILTLSFAVPAQKKATDRDMEGFRGEVKTVQTEYVETINSSGKEPNKTRRKSREYFFDKDGRLAQTLYDNFKGVYTVVDGFRTYKSYELQKKDYPTGSIGETEPLDKSDKIGPPDERFFIKYTYKYDPQGRITEERVYLNTGETTQIRTFKYDEKNRVIEEIKNDRIALTKYTYKYDDAGNLIEQLEDRDIKGAGVDSKSKHIYSEYKLDAKGNWIERRSTWYFEVNGKPLVQEYIYYRTISYY